MAVVCVGASAQAVIVEAEDALVSPTLTTAPSSTNNEYENFAGWTIDSGTSLMVNEDPTSAMIVTESEQSYLIWLDGEVDNRSITLSNIGEDVVVNPWVTVGGVKDWFSTSRILDEILQPGMTNREKALAIWAFLVDNRYHDQPAHTGIETHDPVRFLNVYGYGFCDDSATNLLVLCESAGIPARVWGLSGHVVPEAYFEGDLAMCWTPMGRSTTWTMTAGLFPVLRHCRCARILFENIPVLSILTRRCWCSFTRRRRIIG